MSINKASFWYPDFVETSAWLDHAPFAFWITSVLRPRCFVELGTHRGYSYFAFCQAAKALGLDARCYAVDSWKGDEHAGFYGEEVFQRVRDYNEARYAAFSRLVRSTFDEALARFADASVDLLHIDGRHFYEDVKHDFESWRPKLSERAVVLFHDTNVRDRDFGVCRLWDELQGDYPTFEFLHGHGLGVLGYGAALPADIKAFFEATSDPRLAAETRTAYARLGGAIKADFTQRQAQAQLAAKLETREAEAKDLASKLRAQETRAGELEAKLEAHTASGRQFEGDGIGLPEHTDPNLRKAAIAAAEAASKAEDWPEAATRWLSIMDSVKPNSRSVVEDRIAAACIGLVDGNECDRAISLMQDLKKRRGERRSFLAVEGIGYLRSSRMEEARLHWADYWRRALDDQSFADDTNLKIPPKSPGNDSFVVASLNDPHHGEVGARICVYTALFGDYDELRSPIYHPPGIDFICFSDRPRDAAGWDVRIVDPGMSHPVLQNRKIKILPYEHLGDYDGSLYIDANFTLLGDALVMFRQWLQDKPFVAWRHPLRSDIYEECEAILARLKHEPNAIIAQYEHFRRQKVPRHTGLISAGFLWRDHRDGNVRKLMELWWDHLRCFGGRDQPGLGYLMWKTGVRPEVMPQHLGTIYKNEFLAPHSHEMTPLELERVRSGRGPRPDGVAGIVESHRIPDAAALPERWAAELEVREARISQTEARLAAAEADRDERAAEIANRDVEIAELNDTRAASDAEVVRLKAACARADAVAAARRAQIKEIHSSTSWRITTPLRAVSIGLGWLLRPARRALEPMRQMGTGQFKRAANASLPYYQRFVPVPVREMIPESVRNAVKRRLRARGLPVPEYAEPSLNKTIAEAETAFRAKDWPAAAARWQVVLDGFGGNEAAAGRARLNLSILRRLSHIDAYKRQIAEYVAARAEKAPHRNEDRRIVIYTAISGNYDSIKLPEIPDPRFDYIFFADAPAPDTGLYQVRPVTHFHQDATRAARFVKTHPHLLLENYDVAIWIDANIMILGDIYPLVEEFLASDKAVAAVPHPLRRSISEELEACVQRKKDNPQAMQEQIARYKQFGFDCSDLIESNLMMFNLRDAATEPFLDTWWAEIDSFSKRDQLSLNYALKQNGIDWHRLMERPSSVRNHPIFAFASHDTGDGPANLLIAALQAPDVDPYAGPSYAEVRDWRIAAQKHRRIDIVVCVHNAPEDVKLCLDAVRRARTSDRQKLIVIDDGSEQPTSRYLEELASEVSWIELHRNEQARGYTKAANQGLAASTGELVILLNSDTVVTDGWAEKMADAVFSTSGAGIVGPMSNAASHQSIPEHRSSYGQTAVNELPPGLTAEDLNRHCEQWTVAGLLPRVPLVHGFCFGVTREVIERIGFFDEDNFPRGYGEENDYCFRATDAGFGLVVATHTYVFHAKSKSYAGTERVALMKAGSEALKRLRGSARVQRSVRTMQQNPTFVSLRQRAQILTESARNEVSKIHADREYYAPPAGLELDRYIAQENKQGIHHAIRYVWAIEAIKDMPPISRILDYGCGEGYGANAIAQAFPDTQVVAIDYDAEAIAIAKERYRRPNLRFMTGDTRQHHPALGDSTFDLAVSFDVLEHVEHRELFFSNLTRYLRPDGQVFLSTPCGGRRPVRANPGWTHHKIEYNASALYDVLRRYFSDVLRIDDATSPFPARHVFNRLDGGSVSYLNILNPAICRGPIKVEDPYADYLSGIKSSVTFAPIEGGDERQRQGS